MTECKSEVGALQISEPNSPKIKTEMLSTSSSSPPISSSRNWIPARVIFVIMCFFGFNLLYAYKVILSMSIIAMINPNASTNTPSSSGSECTTMDDDAQEVFPGVKYDWDLDIKTQVLMAFFYGYIITQIPAGILGGRFGAKWIFGGSLLITGIFSILGPVSARIDYRLFMLTRVIQGLAEGVVFPCSNCLIAQWIPKMERSRGTAVIQIGAMSGTVITLPLAAFLNKSNFLGSWEGTFYILGVAGVIWFCLFSFLVYESPETHPFISKEERDYIISNGGGLKTDDNVDIPWKKILTSVPVWAIIITHFGQNWGFLTVLNLMPTYVTNVLHLKTNKNMIIAGLPYLGQAIFGVTLSVISDKIRASGRLEVTTIRKINSSIAYIPGAIFFMLIPTAGCNQTYATLLLILIVTFNGATFSGLNSTHVDMSPIHAGILMGLTNSFGNIPGFFATYYAGVFTKSGETVHNWSYVFYTAAVVFILTNLVYCLFASAKEQPWAKPKIERKAVQKRTENIVSS